MDVGDSRSASPRADRGEPEAVGRFGQAAEDAFDLTDQSQVSAYRPSAAASAATWMATTGQAATCSAAKEAASSWSGDGTYESGEYQAGRNFGGDLPSRRRFRSRRHHRFLVRRHRRPNPKQKVDWSMISFKKCSSWKRHLASYMPTALDRQASPCGEAS